MAADLQARAFGVTAAVAATAASTTVMPLQAANFVHLLAYGIFLVRGGALKATAATGNNSSDITTPAG